MNYISTRGQAPTLNFEQVLLAGLASDGGLYVPEKLPTFGAEEISSWTGLGYSDLAFEIVAPFVGDSIPDNDLKTILSETYAEFRHPAIAPLVQIDTNDWVLELFQGPTLAFKDFALQLLGRLLDYVLSKRDERVAILGATSGDTGSAAIEGCRHCENVDMFILHPYQRVSEFQRRQMTTVHDDNVFNLAIEGNFDDCQGIVKACFRDQSFLPESLNLVAVNSINWARIMAQIVYYFYAALSMGSPHRAVTFSVPTGNFGDIFAGYLAGQMGLRISDLIVATNKNDVLHRIMSSGRYERTELYHTLSPSMDICISSNFERLMFDLYKRDGNKIRQLMEQFETQAIELDQSAMAVAREQFSSAAVDDSTTCQVIADIYHKTGYLLDPHSATAVGAAQRCRKTSKELIVCLATAHPAKFDVAIKQANIGIEPAIPEHMQDIFDRQEKYDVLPNEQQRVAEFISQKLASR